MIIVKNQTIGFKSGRPKLTDFAIQHRSSRWFYWIIQGVHNCIDCIWTRISDSCLL